MCLSVPGIIISIDGNMARVSVGGAELDVAIAFLDNPKTGDYVLVHAGVALQVIGEEDAQEMLKLISEIE